MNSDDPDPVQRWRSVADWYADFAAMRHWEFLTPMVGLTAWVARQPFADQLFPHTSHEWLCVQLKPGYNPDLPFFSCGVQMDGQVVCELWAAVGCSLRRRVGPFLQAREIFAEFVGLLHGISANADPGAALAPTSRGDEPIPAE